MKNRKMALARSMLALLLCLSMLVGTTFAWFTDSVKSGINTVAAGVLDVELYHSNAAVTNEKVGSNTKLFMDLQGKPIVWEPGVVSYENLRIANEGDLALAYQLAINTANENYVLDPSGAQYGLSQILKVGFVKGGISATDRAGVVASVEDANWTTMSGFLRSGALLPEGAGTSEEIWGIVIYWEPGDNDNLWNLNNGKYLNEGESLSVDLGICLTATQEVNEYDAFGRDYDITAAHPRGSIDVLETAPILDKAENGIITAPVSLGNASSGVDAEIPEGVVLAEGATELTLSVKTMETSQANVALKSGETKTSLDVHIAGIAEDNTVPMFVTVENLFAAGLNQGNYSMYHVEDGITVAMVCVSSLNELDAHNEVYYDVATGTVVMCVASFSEYVAVTDDRNPWKGGADTTWYDESATEFILENADDFAGFRDLVDEGISFAGKTVKLAADIDLFAKDENGNRISFNPIGCGYVNGTNNSDGVTGRAFMGIFDGQNHTISNLYQNGWELGLSYCNLGGGLFASIANGTVKNLTITDADVVMECVEQGVLVGLSQGNCTYDNIKIYNSKVANYQRATGGLIGEVSAMNGGGTTVIRNVDIASDVVVGSLWGDFDAPVGGVIGARWDDANVTTVEMENVTVACRLDVYNDVTSTYQWYAYRRAGMLIGNTDQADGHTAVAPFLVCKNVQVYYASWVKYHYCEFNNHNSSWPWVRVEEGENCTAFSNPRYGVPNDPVTDRPVTGFPHYHSGDDECNVELVFNQLYGGGQGVYGAPNHDGVDVINYRYSITYVNDSKVLAIKYVTEDGAVKTENDDAKKLVEQWAAENITGTWAFGGWMNAGSTKLSEIAADNTKDIVLYPYFNKPYTARFVDQKGNVLAWCLFHAEDLTKLDKTKDTAQSQLPSPGKDFEFDYWEVNVNGKKVQYAKNSFASYTTDVTIYPVYRYTGNLKLTPVDEDNDGTIDYYKVEAVDVLDEVTTIPGNVNGVPVKLVEKLYKNDNNWDFGSGVKTIIMEEGVEELAHNSLGYTEDLTTVKLPSTLKVLGKNTFSRNTGDDKKVITIEYAGTMAEWQEILNNPNSSDEWHNGLKTGTKVICTDGYYELKMTEILWGAYQKYEWTAYPNS